MIYCPIDSGSGNSSVSYMNFGTNVELMDRLVGEFQLELVAIQIQVGFLQASAGSNIERSNEVCKPVSAKTQAHSPLSSRYFFILCYQAFVVGS